METNEESVYMSDTLHKRLPTPVISPLWRIERAKYDKIGVIALNELFPFEHHLRILVISYNRLYHRFWLIGTSVTIEGLKIKNHTPMPFH